MISFWEFLGLVATGAGTLASILGIFFAVYARRNGRETREFITAENREMREFIAAQNRDMREFTEKVITAQNRDMRDFIAAENKNMREFLAEVLERLGNRISQEGERTREEIRRLRQSTG